MKKTKKSLLEVFDNAYPNRMYEIKHVVDEFTSLCPKTGHPDFGKIIIYYIPRKTCVELKSLKIYMQSFRNDGIFYESITNKILDDLVSVLDPWMLRVTTKFTGRGGIHSVVRAIFESDEYIEYCENVANGLQ
ncbi:MAG: preQ(1) synthase [Bacteroidota bacterium]|nr:preQ(1) synthase [Bacteroidota bacterium]